MCRIVQPYNGRFFPLFSQGCRTCITFPINDDPRLAVAVGDEILVTHCHRQWLYGVRMSTEPARRRKGWFPKRTAVLLVKQYSDNELKELLGGGHHQQQQARLKRDGEKEVLVDSGGDNSDRGGGGNRKGDNKKNK